MTTTPMVWGTATGESTVLAGLTLGNITWIQGGVIEITAPGEDLSDAMPGHLLTVSGASFTVNNGTFLILSRNTADEKLTILNTARMRSTDAENETSSGAAGTVVSSAAVKTEISAGKLALGFFDAEEPSAGVLNKFLNNQSQWAKEIDDATDRDYLIGRRLVEGANVTLTPVGTAGSKTERIDVEISDTPFSVTGHGFTLGQAIRWNGSAWALAQGDTEENATDVWIVTGVPDVDSFFAYKTGRRTATGHGLGSAGDTLYLSNDTAGALTSTRPDSDYYLPVCTVVDANTLDVTIDLIPRYERRPLILATGAGTVPNTGSPDYENLNATVNLSEKANQRLRLVGRLEKGSQSAYFVFSNISYTGRSGRTIGKEYSTGTTNPSVSSISTNSDTELRLYVGGISSNLFSGDYLFDFEIIYNPDAGEIRVIENTQGSSGEIKAFAKFTGVTLPATPLLYRVYADNFDPYEFTLERKGV